MSSESNYSRLERLLHRLAFDYAAVQLTAADIETSMFGGQYRHIAVERPVFITSLPRAGTTLVLQMLTEVAALATHTYRDMPLVLAPLLWDRLSTRFRKPADLRERAHGDGMLVGYDSAEAFEEVVWKAFWPEKYEADRIHLWAADEDATEFRDFFLDHMRKIIALRSGGDATPRRYVSKNNANIARVSLLKRMFPDAVIVVPIRDPIAQASSLRRQHRRFLALHKEDPFSKRYMSDIGHLEFGELHRPLAFPGMDQVKRQYSTDSLDYWIAYCSKAFAEVREHADEVMFLSYERLCETGTSGLRVLARAIGFDDASFAESKAADFHAPRETSEDRAAISTKVRDEAYAVYEDVLARSIL